MSSFIPLFLADFRRYVRSEFFKSEVNKHPVFYYEEPDVVIYFYKPIGSIIYQTTLIIPELPDNFNLNNLKIELGAEEIPTRIDAPKKFISEQIK